KALQQMASPSFQNLPQKLRLLRTQVEQSIPPDKNTIPLSSIDEDVLGTAVKQLALTFTEDAHLLQTRAAEFANQLNLHSFAVSICKGEIPASIAGEPLFYDDPPPLHALEEGEREKRLELIWQLLKGRGMKLLEHIDFVCRALGSEHP